MTADELDKILQDESIGLLGYGDFTKGEVFYKGDGRVSLEVEALPGSTPMDMEIVAIRIETENWSYGLGGLPGILLRWEEDLEERSIKSALNATLDPLGYKMWLIKEFLREYEEFLGRYGSLLEGWLIENSLIDPIERLENEISVEMTPPGGGDTLVMDVGLFTGRLYLDSLWTPALDLEETDVIKWIKDLQKK